MSSLDKNPFSAILTITAVLRIQSTLLQAALFNVHHSAHLDLRRKFCYIDPNKEEGNAFGSWMYVTSLVCRMQLAQCIYSQADAVDPGQTHWLCSLKMGFLRAASHFLRDFKMQSVVLFLRKTLHHNGSFFWHDTNLKFAVFVSEQSTDLG